MSLPDSEEVIPKWISCFILLYIYYFPLFITNNYQEPILTSIFIIYFGLCHFCAHIFLRAEREIRRMFEHEWMGLLRNYAEAIFIMCSRLCQFCARIFLRVEREIKKEGVIKIRKMVAFDFAFEPEWMKVLRYLGLLDRRELGLIADVRSELLHRAEAEIVDSSNDGDSNIEELTEKLSTITNNFKKVAEQLKKYSRAGAYFRRHYPGWQKTRQCHIRELRKIAKDLETEREINQGVRGISSGISIFGGVLSLVGIGNPLLMQGVRFLTALASTGVSANAVRTQQLKVKEAEAIIKHDREYFKELWSWMSDSSALDKAMENIKYIDLEEKLKSVISSFWNYHNLQDKQQKKMIETLVMWLKSKNLPPPVIEGIVNTAGILMATSMLSKRCQPLFYCLADTRKLFCQGILTLDIIRTGVAATSSCCGSSELTKLQKTLLVSGIILDGCSIVEILTEMGSKHEAEEYILETADLLEEEADLFKKVSKAIEILSQIS